MSVFVSGLRNRQTGSHGLNEFSSRSHSMLTLTIDTEQQDPDDENLYITKRGKLTFVDLAGESSFVNYNIINIHFLKEIFSGRMKMRRGAGRGWHRFDPFSRNKNACDNNNTCPHPHPIIRRFLPQKKTY